VKRLKWRTISVEFCFVFITIVVKGVKWKYASEKVLEQILRLYEVKPLINYYKAMLFCYVINYRYNYL